MTKITITQWSVHNHSFNVLFSIRITTIEEPKLFPVRLHNRWYIRCKWLWDICGDWGTGPWKSCPHLLQIGVQSLAIGDHQNSKYFFRQFKRLSSNWEGKCTKSNCLPRRSTTLQLGISEVSDFKANCKSIAQVKKN